MMKISDITIEKIKNGHFQNELPELFELKECIEDNTWHKNDSVFDHTVAVLEKLEELLENINNGIDSYLNERINKYTKKELLFLGTVLHDIAKDEVFTSNDGLTSCPGHEEAGAEKTRPILDKFGLSDREKEIITDIVKYHGRIHYILTPENKELNEQYESFKTECRNIFTELILLAAADTLGSQLDENAPEEFTFRMDFYKNILDNY